MRSALAPLKVPAFAQLLTSYTVNELGDSVGVIALAVLVYDETGDPLATTALFVAGRFLPALLAPALTAKLDGRRLRHVLPALYLVEALAFVLLAVIAESFTLVPVLTLALIDGGLALTGRALTRGAVAGVLKPAGLLREGNALINVGFAVAAVGGAALAGWIVSLSGPSAALLFDAASFAIIAALLAASRTLPQAEVDEERLLDRIRAGFGYAWRRARVRFLLFGQAVAFVMFTLVVPIEVIYAKDTLDAGDAGFGLLLSAWGGGIVIGSLLNFVVRRYSSALLIIASTLAIAIAYLGMAAAGSLAVACALSVLGGVGNGIQWISVVTALQEATPERLQARVVGLLESAGAAMPGVGYLIGGLLTNAGSPRLAFAVAGGGLIAVLVVGGALAARAASDFDDDGEDHRSPAEAVVDERRDVVVDEAL